ncbi:putative 4-hydroxyphenylpyruvate dioxygenase [Aspergillus costaricaensis CBS 115574]|uniref:4-hydroxyphenylpyruvate dioxygenase n=1 Tax=Aspergillus costaricaensis CBS 115574 TaxID=1448317 RepID=A0ACD1IMY2_9EURO|nr:putative 4-hydroxyphenylpyruvate dioxygenase [Aspergillus costaricaensis CBS 115574]RAK91112.1 putative 4-hydroxyphenylpyruvate dioxygenase [Aspergillus costaricaensis CBS 115574]
MFYNPLAITTSSLGLHPSHSLTEKIRAAASASFFAIEIVYQELEDYALSQTPPVSIHDAARTISRLCLSANLSVLSLSPFKNFEGHNSPLEERLDRARNWLEIAACLKAKYLQVPSQFDTGNSSGDWTRMVEDLQALSDLAASYSVGIAYEAVAWGTYIDTWEESLRMAQDVNRENFGLCLDSFHVAARVWGDNMVESGIREDADLALRQSLDRFVETCPSGKIFYVQLSDAEKFVPSLQPGHHFYREDFPPALSWSRNMRPFPLEEDLGAYFPVAVIAHAWLNRKGWKGVVSIEIFDWRMRDESRRPSDNVGRAVESMRKLTSVLGSTTY